MVDLSKYHLIGRLVLEPPFQPAPRLPILSLTAEPPSAAPSGVTVEVRSVVQAGPTVRVPPPTEVYSRSRDRFEISLRAGKFDLTERGAHDPYENYYQSVGAHLQYLRTSWGEGRWWQGALGGALQGSVVWGDFHNNGSFMVGGYACAAVRQRVFRLEDFLAGDVTLYVGLGLAYAEQNFGRIAEHVQPLPTVDLNGLMGVEAAVVGWSEERFSVALTASYWLIESLFQSSQIEGRSPTGYEGRALLFGIRLSYDPRPTRFPVPIDAVAIERERGRANVAENNYRNLFNAVSRGISNQPTQDDYARRIRELNEGERALCLASHASTLWFQGQPPPPWRSFQFYPGQTRVETLRTRVRLDQLQLSSRDMALDRLAADIRRLDPDIYLILDGYSVGHTSRVDRDASRERVLAVKTYFDRVHTDISDRIIVDEQSAHGSDIARIVAAPGGDTHYYLNNAVTFTLSPTSTRTPHECVPRPEDARADDSGGSVRVHWSFQPVPRQPLPRESGN